jgi:hypothetical protein
VTVKGLGPFYPVNQEKIIGLIYFYVLETGDTGFLKESVSGKLRRAGEVTQVCLPRVTQAVCS